ncbi:MAG: sensor N-terminal transmembrane domain-containing protein, partial [Pseudomonadota bacterium]
MSTPPARDGDVVLGEDWVAPDSVAPSEMRDDRARRGLFSLRASPLTRKIITFNLIALHGKAVAGGIQVKDPRHQHVQR